MKTLNHITIYHIIIVIAFFIVINFLDIYTIIVHATLIGPYN